MVDLWVELVALAALIGLSGFFSGLEVALVGVRKSTVVKLYHDNVKGSHALYRLKHNPGWMMASVNLGNNLVNVGSSAFATSIAIRLFGNDGLGIAVGVMTFLILVFGEITPKTYCNANAAKISLRCAGILLVFSYAFYPIVKGLEAITKGIVKVTGSSYLPPPLTEEDIRGVIDEGMRDKAIEREERDLVRGALKFDDTVVRTVMIHRNKMFSLPAGMMLFEALPLINHSGHSRIPIYRANKDDIVGFVHVRDVLKELEKDDKMIPLQKISREPVFVSQEKMVSALLKEMKGRKTHMAIVVDEYGGVEGLVTLEDLLEEIVGEIEDETDRVIVDYQKVDDNTIITTGDIEINKINLFFKTQIPLGEDYASLSGLLHEKLHDIPQEGDKVEIGNLRIIVEKVERNRPEKIRIEKID